MGTGIVAMLLTTIPYQNASLYYLSIIFFVLNLVLFATALGISILRYALYPGIWTVMIQDPTNSLFLATMPMGFATLGIVDRGCCGCHVCHVGAFVYLVRIAKRQTPW